jgi:hypothetical protein
MIFTNNSKQYGNVEVLIDDEDYDRIKGYNWFVNKQRNSLRVSRTKVIDNKITSIILSRYIINAPEGMVVDHINHNTLDNRKCNLRICTHQENLFNTKVSNNKVSSKYKGVYKNGNKFQAKIKHNNKVFCLGSFYTQEEAAKAYDIKAIELFGGFAKTNV